MLSQPAAASLTPPAPESTQLDSTQPDSAQINSTQRAPVAPARDFNKRANSIERDALPAGLFPGASKKLYDALYLRTRGAVVPVRTVKTRRSELMRWASIGGLNTFLSHMKHLTAVGLVVRTFEVGDKDGAIYEVRLPEELDSTQLDSTQLDSTPNRVHDSTQKLSRVESSKTVEKTGSSGDLKTSFKTNTEKIDDEAFARLRSAAKEITGREASDWSELEEVLITELKIAAGRTTVSSVPAFLAEHLRRRLWKKDKKQIAEEGKAENPQSAIPVNSKDCPDCFGTGMWYPEGFERGVARCGHDKLTNPGEITMQ
jgi:hypothetical protein